MSDRVHIPGARRVLASLDAPSAERAVVACPPHPQHGGSRSDPRLRAVADTLAPDAACLRIDYGAWDEGVGERVDASNALSWAADRYDAVGLLGYSFGAAVALRAAAETDSDLRACVALAPPAGLTGERDVVEALGAIDAPVRVLVGERDTTVDWRPVADRARELGLAVESVPDGHQFADRTAAVADSVAAVVRERL